jgi:hypothetical protein
MPIMDGFEACQLIIDFYQKFDFQLLLYGNLEKFHLKNDELHR